MYRHYEVLSNMIKLRQWEKLSFQPFNYLAAQPCMRWCGHSFKPKAIIALLALLKAGFNNRTFSPGASNLITTRRTNPTWLIFCLRNVKVKIFFNFCFVTRSRSLNNKILSLKPSDKKCLQSFFIFLSRALADVSEKNEKNKLNKLKKRLCTGYWSHILAYSFLISKEEWNLKGNIRLILT